MAYSMLWPYATVQPTVKQSKFMRLVALLAALAVLPTAAPPALAAGILVVDSGPGQHRGRDQDAALRAAREGHILPLAVIRSRVSVPGAEFIGADFDSSGSVYRLKFMRGGSVIWVDVDARTGRTLGRAGY